MNAPAAGQKRLVIVGASRMVGGYGGALGSGCGDFLPRYVYRSVSDAELRKVTVDYAIEFARVLRGSSPDVASRS
jgi:hypothetical protein